MVYCFVYQHFILIRVLYSSTSITLVLVWCCFKTYLCIINKKLSIVLLVIIELV